MHLVLASASPRRAELLQAAGFTFTVLAVDVDERVHADETPDAYVRRLAMEKSARAMERLVMEGLNASQAAPQPGPSPVVIGADTAVVVDGDIFGKPTNDADARAMLRRLSGRVHQVMTGVSLRAGSLEVGRVERTAVEFLPLSEADVSWYVGSGEGLDKAGAYAIQGLAARFIPRIDGSYSNVVGLPISAVHQLLAVIASRT
jgi:septum formation protein